jgi:hypothetical protein
MRIIVTFAVQAEFSPWRRKRDFKRIGESAFMMQSGGTEVYALITGIGARKFHLPTADICLVSGVAGSLKTQHRMAKALRRESSETVMTSGESLVRAATQCGATPVDFFCTAGAVVSSPCEKSRLGQIADAVDMESYQIMAEAQQQGIPAVTVRAISDTADQNLPLDFNRAVSEDGKINWLSALSQVAASPGRLPQLMRFGLESSRAARKLAHFLDRYLKCLTSEADLQFARRDSAQPQLDNRMEVR